MSRFSAARWSFRTRKYSCNESSRTMSSSSSAASYASSSDSAVVSFIDRLALGRDEFTDTRFHGSIEHQIDRTTQQRFEGIAESDEPSGDPGPVALERHDEIEVARLGVPFWAGRRAEQVELADAVLAADGDDFWFFGFDDGIHGLLRFLPEYPMTMWEETAKAVRLGRGRPCGRGDRAVARRRGRVWMAGPCNR